MTFVGRAAELAALEDLWGMRRQVALLWGRRRVGKTTLIDRFAAGKPCISFQADDGTATEQLARLTDRILAFRDDPLLRAAPLANWDQALAYLLRLTREQQRASQPLLVVLDEFPRLVASAPRLPSMLQDALEDVRREDLPLFLVIAGSQIGLYERHVLHGPLYGRRTWGQQLPPLSPTEAAGFFPTWSPADRLRAWAVLGGVPYYLEQWSPDRSLAWNVTQRVLTKGAVLYDEAELLVKEELGSAAATYLSMISAVAGGATRQSEIASKAGIPATSAPSYLDQLGRLHILEHRNPLGSSAGKRNGIWAISDPYLRFWFSFVRANRTDLELRAADRVWRERVAPVLDEWVSQPAFEEVVRFHARTVIGDDPAFPARGEVGTWWGPIPDDRAPGSRRTRQGEVDVVAYDGRDLVLAGEAKWTSRADTDALDQLLRTVVHVPGHGPDTRLAIYARDGFTVGLERRARERGVILRTVADLYP